MKRFLWVALIVSTVALVFASCGGSGGGGGSSGKKYSGMTTPAVVGPANAADFAEELVYGMLVGEHWDETVWLFFFSFDMALPS